MLTRCSVLPSDRSADVNEASLVWDTKYTRDASWTRCSVVWRRARVGTGAIPAACYEATFPPNVEGCPHGLSSNTATLGPTGDGKPEVRDATGDVRGCGHADLLKAGHRRAGLLTLGTPSVLLHHTSGALEPCDFTTHPTKPLADRADTVWHSGASRAGVQGGTPHASEEWP